jgi:hypothetical protein
MTLPKTWYQHWLESRASLTFLFLGVALLGLFIAFRLHRDFAAGTLLNATQVAQIHFIASGIVATFAVAGFGTRSGIFSASYTLALPTSRRSVLLGRYLVALIELLLVLAAVLVLTGSLGAWWQFPIPWLTMALTSLKMLLISAPILAAAGLPVNVLGFSVGFPLAVVFPSLAGALLLSQPGAAQFVINAGPGAWLALLAACPILLTLLVHAVNRREF